MAVSLKHNFVSAVPDGGDTSLVRPSNWNEEHDLTLATNRLLGRTTAGAGVAEEIATGDGLVLADGTLSSFAVVAVSDSPPSEPAVNSIWWDSTTGTAYIRYDDGVTTQWVAL